MNVSVVAQVLFVSVHSICKTHPINCKLIFFVLSSMRIALSASALPSPSSECLCVIFCCRRR
jgi:hypothetical protein